jgi:putative Ca2+/H+ antiporter (TMEM165/GDT1 family)
MLPILLATYVAVFAAEIVGDKLLYTTGVLATRYRTTPIVIGMVIAFMGKMAVAVLVGQAIARLPVWLVATVTTLNFLGIAYTLWRKPDQREAKKESRASSAALVSFAAIFFSEWGDVGQLTAATMAARFGAPLLVWIGAVTAMATKGALAASIGGAARQWIQDHFSPKTIRYAAVGLLLLLGILAAFETVFEREQAAALFLGFGR